MKTILVGINAKYIHTNLAIRYLKGMIEDKNVDIVIREFTINNSMQYILSELYKESPEVLCFSCYIWNIEIILSLCKHLKKVLPGVLIILGGPEVSFNTKELMEQEEDIDIVIVGEGEIPFKELIGHLYTNTDYSGVPNIAYRAKGHIFLTSSNCYELNMNQLPFPYTQGDDIGDKIIYYESSRGCPFNCQYCLSSSTSGVRFLSIERIKRDLKYFLDMGVNQVKFVDRTFNANKGLAIEIIEYILEHNNSRTNFHFEIAADIIDESFLNVIKKAPVGLFQFEIGVQSTNKETLEIISRKMDFELVRKNVKIIKSYGNIHQHLDLIAGLPKEDYFSFRQSFDDVFSLRPEKLQIGFLKLLKGSGLRNRAREYGYIFLDVPPYEVLETEVLTFGDIIKLKGIEEMVETYYNTNMFKTSLNYILENYYESPFRFFEELFRFWLKEGLHHVFHSKNQLYEILFMYYREKDFPNINVFNEILKFDYLRNNKTSSLPSILNRNVEEDFKNKCHKFLQNEKLLLKYLPSYVNLPAKQIIKRVHFEKFEIDVTEVDKNPRAKSDIINSRIVVLFDYEMEKMSLDYSKNYAISSDVFDSIDKCEEV